jgi:arylsulfatase A-like enzyme
MAQRSSDVSFVLGLSVAAFPFFAALKVLLILDDIAAGAAVTPGPVRLLLRFAMAVHADMLFLVVLGLVSAGLLRLARPSRIGRAAVRVLLVAAYVVVAAWTVATYVVWQVLHEMLSIHLYRLAGGVGELDPGVAATAVRAIPLLAGGAVAFLVLRALAGAWLARTRLRLSRRQAVMAGAALAAYVGAGTWRELRRPSDLAQSPVAHFVWTWIAEPPEFGAGVVVPADPEAMFGPLDVSRRQPQESRHARTGIAQKNVILVVLESVGARFMHVFGGEWDNTPVLDAWKGSALMFSSAYAHAPMTNEAALTLQCSVHPRTGNTPTVGAMPRLAAPDLAGVLRGHGYRTAFICQTLLGWQGRDFFRDRSFDHYSEEYETWRDRTASGKIDDQALLQRALRWIDAAPGRPFFLMLWTYQGHFPHYTVGVPVPRVPERPRFNRYLSAIQENDRLLGDLAGELAKRGLYDSTLIVVTADHGQTFSPTSDERAARDLFETALNVPLIFIHAGRSGVDDRPVGHIDVAPSVLDLLGYEAPREWQGRSVFAPARPSRIYMTSSYKLPALYGLRDGRFKFITDGAQAQLYDLESDPEELHNIAAQHNEICQDYTAALVAWHRYQPRYLDQFRSR